MIRGFNIWYATDAVEGPSIGVMCLVGARDGSRVVITEAEVDNGLLQTFAFTSTPRKGALHDVSGTDPQISRRWLSVGV